jgi:exodeoxyribonuclease VII large subunit
MDAPILSVAEYIKVLNDGLKNYPAKILGEISQVSKPVSGHVYFTLKDAGGASAMRCIIWRSGYAVCGVDLTEGMQIIANGTPNIYAPRGELSFVARTVELAGEGELKKAYDALKAKLGAEGLLSEERKRPIPKFPRTIGLITSRGGEVIHDFLMNIGKHGFKIQFVHSGVEGQEAALSLLEAVRTLKQKKIDVLVIMRGGGSLESLQGFNNEMLVRELCDFPAPVIAAIGHHRDAPLVALVADAAVSTPTAAAHLLNQPWDELGLTVLQAGRRITDAYADVLNKWIAECERAAGAIPDQFESILENVRHAVTLITKTITLNDPRRQFRLGFSIARSGGTIVRKTGDAPAGAILETEVQDGTIVSEVQKKE